MALGDIRVPSVPLFVLLGVGSRRRRLILPVVVVVLAFAAVAADAFWSSRVLRILARIPSTVTQEA
uniref:Uncharacterized protein n=1 Tax=Nymphaea colorata TaxID=210225 RepID=A0A5K0WE53_9MAGN